MTPHEPRIAARLESKEDVSEGLSIFRFSLNNDFHFRPGQYATLWLTHKGKTVPRPYSIASAPSQTRKLEFYINLVADGRLTPSLWEPEVLHGLFHSEHDTAMEVTGPKGRFVLDAHDPRDLVFVASGTGLGPFISMIRELTEELSAAPSTFLRQRIYLIHGVSLSSHLGYRDELEKMAAAAVTNPDAPLSLVYLPTISRPHIEPSWTGLRGRAETLFESVPCPGGARVPECIVKSMLAVVIRPETHVVYVCGHPGTVDNVSRTLAGRGFKPDLDFKREKYYP
jgi:NAD(P)H-flavin reductase